MNVKYIKLVTGEDLVSGLKEENDYYLLSNPTRLVISQEGMGLMPFSPFTKSEEIKIKKDHVIFIDDLEEEIQNAYNARYGTGIVTSSNILLK